MHEPFQGLHHTEPLPFQDPQATDAKISMKKEDEDHYEADMSIKDHYHMKAEYSKLTSTQRYGDTFLSKTPIAPCYCQMMGRTLKEEIRITQYNNTTKVGKYSLEDLFRASDNIPHHYPKF